VKAQGQLGGRGRRLQGCGFGCVHVLVRCGRGADLLRLRPGQGRV
jgi:hypothetical protein